ncbi:hypothetical protein KGF54_000830 [Candida jiufengensis]|uniref:uncharacterized protein n=1 Tax=Candida jiufengensis TaxID=497108 RepID=UPI0022249B9B|nr:uncharacterized protein KGF54_000830 [Candida jiufengensis]KAI5956355.1 hypothetical protein KGF54_000830 [Candida jiufengensis]
MLQPSYKSLQRQLRRLPLPTNAIKDGSAVLKHRYKLGKTKIFETIFTQILQYEKYHKSIPLLLDAIYKDSKPKWYRDFINIPYMQVKKDWPTMHIIDELTKDTKTISMYHEKLQSPFRLVDHVKGKDKVKKNAFPIFTKYSDQTSSVPRLINDVEKAYKFLMNESIFNLTKHPFEVIHLPTKMGTPEHPVGLDTNLRDTVTLH